MDKDNDSNDYNDNDIDLDIGGVNADQDQQEQGEMDIELPMDISLPAMDLQDEPQGFVYWLIIDCILFKTINYNWLYNINYNFIIFIIEYAIYWFTNYYYLVKYKIPMLLFFNHYMNYIYMTHCF